MDRISDEQAGWWLTEVTGRAVGPVSSAFLLERIRTGALRGDALVCAVGGDHWQRLCDVPAFVGLARTPARRFDPAQERCVVDQEALSPDWGDASSSTSTELAADEISVVAVPLKKLPAPPPLLGVEWRGPSTSDRASTSLLDASPAALASARVGAPR